MWRNTLSVTESFSLNFHLKRRNGSDESEANFDAPRSADSQLLANRNSYRDQHHQASAGIPVHIHGTGSWRSVLVSLGGRRFVLPRTTSVAPPPHPTPPPPPVSCRSPTSPRPQRFPPADRHGRVGPRHAGDRPFRLHPVLRSVVYALNVHHLRVSRAWGGGGGEASCC